MGVDTKGVLVSRCKDVLLTSELVSRAIDRLVLEERHIVYPSASNGVAARGDFSTCSLNLSPDIGLVSFNFVFRGEARSLKLFYTCDCDHTDLGAQSLSLMLGCHGHSVLFMKTALHALSLLGTAYVDDNDCDSVDAAPLGERPLTVLGAVQLGYIRASSFCDWVEAWAAGSIGDGRSFEAYFGMDEATAYKLTAADAYKDAWDQIQAMAMAAPSAMPSFMAEYHELQTMDA